MPPCAPPGLPALTLQSQEVDAAWLDDLAWLRAARGKALERGYFVFEPLSVFVPSLCSHELGQVCLLSSFQLDCVLSEASMLAGAS